MWVRPIFIPALRLSTGGKASVNAGCRQRARLVEHEFLHFWRTRVTLPYDKFSNVIKMLHTKTNGTGFGMNMKTVRGRMHSRKMGTIVEFHTALQRDFIYLLDYNRAVVVYQTHPFEMQLPSGQLHIPDFWVEYEDGSNYIIDCVYELNETRRAKELRRDIAEYCRERHIEYRIVTNDELWSDYLLMNLKSLFACRMYLEDESLKQLAETILEAGQEITAGELLDLASSAGLSAGLLSLKTLAWNETIDMDLRTGEISRLTSVRLAQR